MIGCWSKFDRGLLGQSQCTFRSIKWICCKLLRGVILAFWKSRRTYLYSWIGSWGWHLSYQDVYQTWKVFCGDAIVAKREVCFTLKYDLFMVKRLLLQRSHKGRGIIRACENCCSVGCIIIDNYCSSRCFFRTKSKDSKILYMILTLFVGLGFIYDSYTQIIYVIERYQLGVSSISRDCNVFIGEVTNISPRSPGGYMNFSLESHQFWYNNHHFALNRQLCSAGGPQLCVGDMAKVCVHDQSSDEILRIDKLERVRD